MRRLENAKAIDKILDANVTDPYQRLYILLSEHFAKSECSSTILSKRGFVECCMIALQPNIPIKHKMPDELTEQYKQKRRRAR